MHLSFNISRSYKAAYTHLLLHYLYFETRYCVISEARAILLPQTLKLKIKISIASSFKMHLTFSKSTLQMIDFDSILL